MKNILAFDYKLYKLRTKQKLKATVIKKRTQNYYKSSKEMGFLNPNFPFFSKSGGAV